MAKKRFSCEEIADMYGVHIQTVWRWIREGRLGAIRLGRNYYVRQADIDEMESRLAVGPAAEREAVCSA